MTIEIRWEDVPEGALDYIMTRAKDFMSVVDRMTPDGRANPSIAAVNKVSAQLVGLVTKEKRRRQKLNSV